MHGERSTAGKILHVDLRPDLHCLFFLSAEEQTTNVVLRINAQGSKEMYFPTFISFAVL